MIGVTEGAPQLRALRRIGFPPSRGSLQPLPAGGLLRLGSVTGPAHTSLYRNLPAESSQFSTLRPTMFRPRRTVCTTPRPLRPLPLWAEFMAWEMVKPEGRCRKPRPATASLFEWALTLDMQRGAELVGAGR